VNARYKLNIQFSDPRLSTMVEYDAAWGEWIFNDLDGEKVYINKRGTIGEGEIAMVLDYMLGANITTLLQPMEVNNA